MNKNTRSTALLLAIPLAGIKIHGGVSVWKKIGDGGGSGRRSFFGLPQLPQLSSRRRDNKMSYAEKRVIGFTCEQMFDVVNTVAEYPKFVPWCKEAKCKRVSDNVVECDLRIGFPPLHERYTSRVTSLYPNVIHSVCTDGRLFHLLDTTWRFGPPPAGRPPNSCTLHFSLEFEFKSALYAQLSHLFFGQVVRHMVAAFLTRAEQIYGPPSFDHFSREAAPEILSYKS